MTTLAFDGTTLAGDRRLTGHFIMTSAAKIMRTPDHRLIGCAGGVTECRMMMEWLMKPKRNLDTLPDFQCDEDTSVQAIEIMQDGTIRAYEQGGWFVVEGQNYAIGSGCQFAMAAMYCGKSADDAVRVASQFDPITGGGVDCLTLLSR